MDAVVGSHPAPETDSERVEKRSETFNWGRLGCLGGSVGGTRDQRAACWINLRRGAEIKPVEWDCLANTIMANTYLGWTSAQWASIYHLLPPRAITDATFHTIHYKRLSRVFALFLFFIVRNSDGGIFLRYWQRCSVVILKSYLEIRERILNVFGFGSANTAQKQKFNLIQSNEKIFGSMTYRRESSVEIKSYTENENLLKAQYLNKELFKNEDKAYPLKLLFVSIKTLLGDSAIVALTQSIKKKINVVNIFVSDNHRTNNLFSI